MTYNPNRALLRLSASLLLLLCLIAYGVSVSGVDVSVDLLARRQAPSSAFWFGTDSLGRDLWLRCFQGMTTSLGIARKRSSVDASDNFRPFSSSRKRIFTPRLPAASRCSMTVSITEPEWSAA